MTKTATGLSKVIKLVIFDMDGVLVDACDWHRKALNMALKEVSGYEISLEDHYSIFNGLPTRVKLSLLVESNKIKKEDSDKIYKMKQDYTIDLINQSAQEDSEKIEMICALKARGLKVACFTNSIKHTAQLMLSKAGVFNLLDMFLSNQDVENSKPAPEGYIKTMENFKMSRNETLIVEDSPKGTKAALASGANVLVVEGPHLVNKHLFDDLNLEIL